MPLLRRILPYLGIFLAVEFLLRLSLLARSLSVVEYSAGEIAQALLRGIWFDIVTASFFILPIALYHLLLPARKQGSRLDRRIDAGWRLVFVFILLFDAVAEHLFWSEFSTRFNFIAVDYLVYTQEVIGNIVESYPIAWIIAAIALAAALLSFGSLKYWPLRAAPSVFTHRLKPAAIAILASTALYMSSAVDQSQFGDNVEAQEVSANGIYNLFAAFWNNEIDYERFYAMHDKAAVADAAQKLRNRPYAQAIDRNTHRVTKAGGERRKNVVIVAMESLSGAYMGQFGNKLGITPHLDRLANEGLFFTNLYATGTRTVRGLEAITLSIPPTPGQSILRRMGNDNLFSLGFIFKDRGYDTRFIYGGYGYFDNMNNFFSANGFDIVDRTSMQPDEVEFANVWGVCDEDMFKKLIKEADTSYAAKKPFAHLLMTTSNHRPYTYPDSRIDIPSRSNRIGGVKYADYSVGKLIEWSKDKPWFKDTVFVFVADHTAGASGKAELDPEKYHIPMIFYAPDFIKPQRIDTLASQIDLAPMLLGLLNFSYPSKFYGIDWLHDTQTTPRSFISNYQKVALVKNNLLTVLAPKRGIAQYHWPDAADEADPNTALIDETIQYYQSAASWRESYKRIPTATK